jgi:branched-chain amino acid transport system permease protein
MMAPGRVEGGVLLALLLALVLVPALVGESDVYLVNNFLITALFAMSYNLLLGQAGMLSFGHASFYGLGAYTVGLAAGRFGLPVLAGFAMAPLVAAALALLTGLFVVRLEGMFFSMLTLAFGQLVFILISSWYSVTGGDDGLPVNLPDWLADTTNFYYVSLVCVAVCIGFLLVLRQSAFGAALTAIRENRQRAASIGLDVRRYQLAAFVLAGALAGVAGALRGSLQQMAVPTLLYWTQSADPILMVLAGGVGTFIGPIVGAALFVALNFVVSGHSDYPLMMFGVIVLAVVLFMPRGLVGSLATIRRRPAGASR